MPGNLRLLGSFGILLCARAAPSWQIPSHPGILPYLRPWGYRDVPLPMPARHSPLFGQPVRFSAQPRQERFVNLHAISRGDVRSWESMRPPPEERARRARGQDLGHAGVSGGMLGSADRTIRDEVGALASGVAERRAATDVTGISIFVHLRPRSYADLPLPCWRHAMRHFSDTPSDIRHTLRRKGLVNVDAISRGDVRSWESVRPPPKERARRARGQGAGVEGAQKERYRRAQACRRPQISRGLIWRGYASSLASFSAAIPMW
jgi:hypothetical protein